jgi:preprotein translocase subunit SecD
MTITSSAREPRANDIMTKNIRNRLILIALLVLASVWAMLPRTVTVRERGADGVMHDVELRRVPPKKGLDLQGGMHLALELDESKRVSSNKAHDIELALTVLRKRIDEFGVTEPVIQKVGEDRIVVELPGVDDPVRAKQIVQRSAFLEFKITDETDALGRALPAMDRTLRSLGVSAAAGAPGAAAGPSAVQQLLGGDSAADRSAAAAVDSVPAGPAVLSSLIQPGQMPGEFLVPETAFPRVDSLLSIPDVRRHLGRGLDLAWEATAVSLGATPYRRLYVLEERPLITGQSLVDAQAQLDPITNGAIVVFDLDRAGARRFGAGTQEHIGDYMAILLEGRVQGQPPVIQSRIDRRGQITLGGRTIQEAQDLALTLRAGALPVPLKIVEQGEVGASLGRDAINSGILAGLIGTAFVVIVMIAYYRMAGVLAVGALMLYVLFVLGGLSLFDATLTLPGLAGLVLSIGIAVDANVLIFERIREELDAGRTIPVAVEQGFEHAMSAIIDSNVTTILTALFLFQFGTGPVKGFAVTLVLGIIASMITAVFVTRTFFLIWLQRKSTMQTLSI